MDWFEEQINARRVNDRQVLDEAYNEAIYAIIGRSFSFDEAEEAISLILAYYHLPAVKLTGKYKDENEKLSAACRMSGLMQRPVELDKDWYKCAFGAFLCKRKDTGEYVACIPNQMGVYAYYDRTLHKKMRMNRKTFENFEMQAICFYKPLPAKELSIWTLLKFGISAWSVSDHLFTYLMLAIATVLGLITPVLNNFLFSTVVEEGSISLLLSTMVFYVSLGITILLLNTMQSMFSKRTGVKMGSAIQSASMMRTLMLPISFFRKYSSGEIMSRMTYMESVCTNIVSLVFSTSLSGLFSLAYITQIVNFAPALLWPSLAVIIANVLFSVYTTYRQMKISRKQMAISAKNSGMAIELISGIQKIKMAGAEERMFARYTKKYAEQAKFSYNPPFFNKFNGTIALAISLAGQFVIYSAALAANIDVAQYYAFQSSYGVISGAITTLVSVTLQFASLRPSLEMMKPILEAIPENSEGLSEVGDLTGSIELNNVSFKYTDDGPNVINDFSLKISSGQYVAITGKTGCGKSTLIRLLLGFEKPQKGAIYYDGKDINSIEKRSLRQKIGTVMQDDKLFTGSIYHNIVICAPTLSQKEAWEAAELAGVAEDIKAMPMGMQTVISEGSGGISGGQRQRITIARAIAPKPKILFFDEATSALDNITQKQVSDSLDSLKCTRVVIAHRLSTIKHCDRILVMDGGKIIEDGTYEELMEKKGEFAALVERQKLEM